ncbi:MAG: response regulator transcription factor [Bacteroidota bacterium]
MQSVKIVIADDHQLFSEGIKNLLRKSEAFDFEIVGEAATGSSLLTLLRRIEPDVLLLDLNMPEQDGLSVLEAIKGKYKDMRILALTMYDDAKLVKSAFKAGVDGYMLKSSDPYELIDAIAEVLQGKTYIGEGVELIANGYSRGPFSNKSFEDKFIKKYNLTKREIEILRLITQALSNKQIAKELFISDQTVSVHRKNIMRKLGVSNTAGLIKLAYDNSLV